MLVYARLSSTRPNLAAGAALWKYIATYIYAVLVRLVNSEGALVTI